MVIFIFLWFKAHLQNSFTSAHILPQAIAKLHAWLQATFRTNNVSGQTQDQRTNIKNGKMCVKTLWNLYQRILVQDSRRYTWFLSKIYQFRYLWELMMTSFAVIQNLSKIIVITTQLIFAPTLPKEFNLYNHSNYKNHIIHTF